MSLPKKKRERHNLCAENYPRTVFILFLPSGRTGVGILLHNNFLAIDNVDAWTSDVDTLA